MSTADCAPRRVSRGAEIGTAVAVGSDKGCVDRECYCAVTHPLRVREGDDGQKVDWAVVVACAAGDHDDRTSRWHCETVPVVTGLRGHPEVFPSYHHCHCSVAGPCVRRS